MISSPRSRSLPWLQAFSKILASRICSRERTGSISFRPIRPSRAVTVPEICSRRSSLLSSQGIVRRFERGQNADGSRRLSRGIDGKLGAVFQAPGCVPVSISHLPAHCATDRPFLQPPHQRSYPPGAPASALIQGWKSAGSRSGKCSRALVISPLGSIINAGISLQRRFFEQIDAQAGLAGAGHTDDHAMGRSNHPDHRAGRSLLL